MRRVAAVLAAAVGLAACGGGGSGGYTYPANVQHNFLNACEQNAQAALCTCALHNIESNVSLKQFAQDEQTFKRTGTLPNRERSAAVNCLGKATGL